MFTWDPLKANINLGKHGVSFEEAGKVFSDTSGLEWEDIDHSAHETRLKRLGVSVTGRVIIVVFTVRRAPDGKEATRIISARQASRKERNAYAE